MEGVQQLDRGSRGQRGRVRESGELLEVGDLRSSRRSCACLIAVEWAGASLLEGTGTQPVCCGHRGLYRQQPAACSTVVFCSFAQHSCQAAQISAGSQRQGMRQQVHRHAASQRCKAPVSDRLVGEAFAAISGCGSLAGGRQQADGVLDWQPSLAQVFVA